jgi:hypothetical protein
MVTIFCVLTMDWIVGLLRIERLTSRHEGQHSGSMDAAPRGGRAERIARGVSALPDGIDEGYRDMVRVRRHRDARRPAELIRSEDIAFRFRGAPLVAMRTADRCARGIIGSGSRAQTIGDELQPLM